MKEVSEREKALEYLLESLIKMLGKSNQRVDDLNKRVHQLESFIRETAMQNRPQEKPGRLTVMN